MKLILKFIEKSYRQKLLLIEAVGWLALSRIAILVFPFRWLAPFLGKQMALSTNQPSSSNRETIAEVSWAIRVTSRRVPWECLCLVQAITGKMMLKRRGVGSTLYLGLGKDADQKFKAHAWLRSHDNILTGGDHIEQFTIISTFA